MTLNGTLEGKINKITRRKFARELRKRLKHLVKTIRSYKNKISNLDYIVKSF